MTKFIFSQLCGASRLDEAYKYHEKVTEIPNETIEKFKSGVLGIKGIGSQAADDLVNVATELKRDLPAYLFYTNTVSIFTLNLQLVAVIVIFHEHLGRITLERNERKE